MLSTTITLGHVCLSLGRDAFPPNLAHRLGVGDLAAEGEAWALDVRALRLKEKLQILDGFGIDVGNTDVYARKSDGQRGLFARQSFQAGAEIVYLPLGLRIDGRMLPDALRRQIDASEVSDVALEVVRVAAVLLACWRGATLKAPPGYVETYLMSLPAEPPQNRVFFDANEHKIVQLTYPKDVEYSRLDLHAVLDLLRGLHWMGVEGAAQPRPWNGFEDVLTMAAFAISRSDDRGHITPWIDFSNHYIDSATHLSESLTRSGIVNLEESLRQLQNPVKFACFSDRCALIALRSVRAGEELVWAYNNQWVMSTMNTYGFVPQPLPLLVTKIPLPKDRRSFGEKCNVLLGEREQLALKVDANAPEWPLGIYPPILECLSWHTSAGLQEIYKHVGRLCRKDRKRFEGVLESFKDLGRHSLAVHTLQETVSALGS